MGFIVIFASLYIIEAASFRLVESYAKFRLNLSWGDCLNSKFNPYLRKLPLDHFSEPITSGQSLNLSNILENELEYSKKILSYQRPVRDRVANYFFSQTAPLASNDVRDLGLIKNVVLPGLRRPATMDDVNQGSAKRVRDDIEFSECLFVYLTHTKKTNEFKNLFSKLEKAFGFLADEGFASVLMPVSSKEAFLAQIKYLQSNYPNFANNLIVYGEADLSSWVLDVAQLRPGIFKACILQDPVGDFPPPSADAAQWLLTLVDNRYDLNKSMHDWIVRSRSAEYLYPSRLGGLLYRKPTEQQELLSTVVLSYALQCKDYLKKAGHHWAVNTLSNEPEMGLDYEEKELNHSKPDESMYLCDAVREYRLLHKDNPSILALSNKELIIKIGESIQALGPSAFSQLSQEDPEFVILYQSLK